MKYDIDMSAFHELYENGYFAQRRARENDPRLQAFRSELYAEEFDEEADAEAQKADEWINQQKENW